MKQAKLVLLILFFGVVTYACLGQRSPCVETASPCNGGASASGGSSSIGGSSIVSVIGGGKLPKCKTQSFMASPENVAERRASIRPRVLIPNAESLIEPETRQAKKHGLIMLRFNNRFCGNQGNLGECVAAAANGVSVTQPFTVVFRSQDELNASFLTAYKWITAHDSYPGTYPPDDTGSDTLTGCKWLVKMGYARSCKVLSGKEQVLNALETGPVMSGISWPSTAYETDSCGVLDMSGAPDGGHDRVLVGFVPAHTLPWDFSDDMVVEQNSWGNDFGVKDEDGHGGLQLVKASDEFGNRLAADFVQPLK